MRTAKKAAFGALAATVMALVGPATVAHADSGDTLSGGCGFNTDQNQIATNGQNQGVIFDASVSQHGDHTPSDAIVSCWIDVNGVQQSGTEITVTDNTVPGVEAGQAQISFAAGDTDLVAECQTVAFADGSSWVAPDGKTYTATQPYCPAATTITIPPPVVQQAIDTLFVTVIDPTICPVLITLGQLTGGGVAGVVTIGPDGDLSVIDPLGLGINPIEDCVPYINPPAGG